VRFWDTSAIIPLLVAEAPTAAITELLSQDSAMRVWMFTPVEILSAMRRKEFETADENARAVSQRRLMTLEAVWRVVMADELTLTIARDVVSRHPLRAADALQLAAAIVAAAGDIAALPFVTLDDRLAAAARAEGFAVLP
jgi:predicted nucleic acid-binding protein